MFPKVITEIIEKRADFFNQYEEELERTVEVENCVGRDGYGTSSILALGALGVLGLEIATRYARKKKTKAWAQGEWKTRVRVKNAVPSRSTLIGQILMGHAREGYENIDQAQLNNLSCQLSQAVRYEYEQEKQKTYVWPELLETSPDIFTTLDPESAKIATGVHIDKCIDHMDYQKNKTEKYVPFVGN
jgi:hypothetical protein